MTMKITRLTTHWDPDEAHTIIEFLDRLRDELALSPTEATAFEDDLGFAPGR